MLLVCCNCHLGLHFIYGPRVLPRPSGPPPALRFVGKRKRATDRIYTLWMVDMGGRE